MDRYWIDEGRVGWIDGTMDVLHVLCQIEHKTPRMRKGLSPTLVLLVLKHEGHFFYNGGSEREKLF